MTRPASAQTDLASREDEFFIGWNPIPPRNRRFLRPVVVALLLMVVIIAGSLSFFQHSPGAGEWDTDNNRTYDGIVSADPYPMLHVAGEKSGEKSRAYLLVEEGKFGAAQRVDRFLLDNPAGCGVRVTGTVLHRDSRWMIELVEGDHGMRPLSEKEQRQVPTLVSPEPQVLAERTTLEGEIIDSKCYLGAMKPGGGKTHKACASLCISGGIPPMLVTRDANRQETFYLLTSFDGGPVNTMVLPFVGDAVEVTGRIVQRGNLLLLQIEFGDIHRR